MAQKKPEAEAVAKWHGRHRRRLHGMRCTQGSRLDEQCTRKGMSIQGLRPHLGLAEVHRVGGPLLDEGGDVAAAHQLLHNQGPWGVAKASNRVSAEAARDSEPPPPALQQDGVKAGQPSAVCRTSRPGSGEWHGWQWRQGGGSSAAACLHDAQLAVVGKSLVKGCQVRVIQRGQQADRTGGTPGRYRRQSGAAGQCPAGAVQCGGRASRVRRIQEPSC